MMPTPHILLSPNLSIFCPLALMIILAIPLAMTALPPPPDETARKPESHALKIAPTSPEPSSLPILAAPRSLVVPTGSYSPTSSPSHPVSACLCLPLLVLSMMQTPDVTGQGCKPSRHPSMAVLGRQAREMCSLQGAVTCCDESWASLRRASSCFIKTGSLL